jgi:hypothetical protein
MFIKCYSAAEFYCKVIQIRLLQNLGILRMIITVPCATDCCQLMKKFSALNERENPLPRSQKPVT